MKFKIGDTVKIYTYCFKKIGDEVIELNDIVPGLVFNDFGEVYDLNDIKGEEIKKTHSEENARGARLVLVEKSILGK